MTANVELLSRDEVLGGLPAKRASALLFLIESRTAHLVDRSRRVMERFATDEAVRERELAFVEAFALGRDAPVRPSIQDLERFAPQWADLIPDNTRLRAAVAHQLGEKYQFTVDAVPAIRSAAGLDETAVRVAYERLYRKPLETIYAPVPSLADRLRWTRTALARRVESLPPFWTAFALTLTETVGVGFLALPIAFAQIGPIPGALLLISLGLVNVLTIAWLAETVSRSANVRYGSAYFRSIVHDYLGQAGAGLVTVALTVICVVVLLCYHIGFSTTLASATNVPASLWMVLLFVVGSYVVSRDSLNSTIASALGIGAVNVTLVVILAVLAFTHVQWDNLSYVHVPWYRGEPFDPAILTLIFGVALSAYFGHISVGNCAQVVLQRDESARSLIWGTVAAQGVAMVIYVGWILGINGALGPEALIGQAGTSVGPLAAEVGPIVFVVGSIFVVLAMGMGSIHVSLGLFNVVRDWLPKPTHSTVLLTRGSARLLFEPRGKPDADTRLGLTYLGLAAGRPRFRMEIQAGDRAVRTDFAVSGRWRARDALAKTLLDHGSRDVDLTLEVVDADGDKARVRVETSMSVSAQDTWTASGVDLTDVLSANDTDWQLLRWMLRQGGVSLAEVAAHTGQNERASLHTLQTLMESGAVREMSKDGTKTYHVRLARRQGRQLPDRVADVLDELIDPEASGRQSSPPSSAISNMRQRFRELLLSDGGRVALGLAPAAVVFLVAEWLVATDRASFTGVVSFIGVIAIPIFAGMFASLLIVVSRRKGDISPQTVYRLLGNPVLALAVYALFLASIFVHGLVIWQEPFQRAAALVAGFAALAVTIAVVRRGALSPRMAVTLREDEQSPDPAYFEVLSGGNPVTVDATLTYADGEKQIKASRTDASPLATLQEIRVQLPPTNARELRIWTHQVGRDGVSHSLPVTASLDCDGERAGVDLRVGGGQALLPLKGSSCVLRIAR